MWSLLIDSPQNKISLYYNPANVEKTMSNILVALRTCFAFFGCGDVGLIHCEDCCLVFRPYPSSPVMTLDMKVGSSRSRWWRSWQNLARSSFWSGVRSLGTNFAAMRCIFKSDIKIACTVSYDTSTMAAMSLMDLRLSSCTSRQIFPFSGVELVEDRPDLLSSPSDVLPLLKRACHSKHLARLIASLSYTRRIMSKDLLNLTENLMCAIYSSLQSVMKSQMCPCTWSQKNSVAQHTMFTERRHSVHCLVNVTAKPYSTQFWHLYFI